MKLTLQVQLLPNHETAARLEATLRAFNTAATWVAGKAFELRSANKIQLQKLYYKEIREKFSLSAQMAVRCIAQACEAYKRDKNIAPVFREFAAMPYDQRMLGFKGLDRVSLLTLTGRVLIPFVMGKYQADRFTNAKGQCDLVRRKDGLWFLLISVDIPDGVTTPTTDFLGVDLGVTNLAFDSDGTQYSGARVETARQHYSTLRAELQSAGELRKASGRRPKRIRKKLKDLGSRETRFRKDVNHCISKALVTKAKDTNRGIALEDLTHIRSRTRFRKAQRNKMSGWAFAQLRVFIAYKARVAGVRVELVDPAYTSKCCSECGSVAPGNRKSQSEYVCKDCGYTGHADHNGAKNIKLRACVNALEVSENQCASAA